MVVPRNSLVLPLYTQFSSAITTVSWRVCVEWTLIGTLINYLNILVALSQPLSRTLFSTSFYRGCSHGMLLTYMDLSFCHQVFLMKHFKIHKKMSFWIMAKLLLYFKYFRLLQRILTYLQSFNRDGIRCCFIPFWPFSTTTSFASSITTVPTRWTSNSTQRRFLQSGHVHGREY